MKKLFDTLYLYAGEILARLTIGFVFINSGYGKFLSLNKVIAFFESLKIPFASIQAPFVAGVELVFGILILIGFKLKWTVIPLIGIMMVALITAKTEDITDFASLLNQSEFLYIVILVGLGVHGSKVLSYDSWRNCHCKKK